MRVFLILLTWAGVAFGTFMAFLSWMCAAMSPSHPHIGLNGLFYDLTGPLLTIGARSFLLYNKRKLDFWLTAPAMIIVICEVWYALYMYSLG